MKSCFFLSVVAAVLFARANALPAYVSRIPNGLRVPGVDALGHADRTGDSGDLDSFGKAFQTAGRKWTKDLCTADSDGDGQTNGEELGDPCCVWVAGATPKFTTGVSNPGDVASKVSTTVLVSNACTTPPPVTTPPPATTAPPPATTAPAPATTAPPPGTTAPTPATTAPTPATTWPTPATTTPTATLPVQHSTPSGTTPAQTATSKPRTKVPHGHKKPRGHLRCD